MQHTSELLMIEPVNFGYNPETAVNNSFQHQMAVDVQHQALREFNGLVNLLKQHHVHVTVVKDSHDPHTPDSVFPNNWVSFHDDGKVFLYPMFAANRRAERKPQVLEAIKNKFLVKEIVDLTSAEQNSRFLEGTGSMVLDRENRIAYACISPRTDEQLFEEFCRITGYSPVTFHAVDKNGEPVYHTNVMMCIAGTFAVVCLDSIHNPVEKERLVKTITGSQKEIVEISADQVNRFAGNMLQVMNTRGELLLVMSSQAFSALSAAQVEILLRHNRILHSPLDTIETAGGGSARCMIAELFLERT
jgi:hypothetical protein